MKKHNKYRGSRIFTCSYCSGHFQSPLRGRLPTACFDCRSIVYKELYKVRYAGRYYVPKKPVREGITAFAKLRLKLITEAGFRCSQCKAISPNLELHHVDGNGYGKTKHPNNDLRNIRVLCPDCHRKVHFNISNLSIQAIERFRLEGKTFEQIGKLYGLSRQRVHQFYNKKSQRS